MRHDVTEAEAEQFRASVEAFIRDVKRDPSKGRDFLIRAGTHLLDEETQSLVLVPQLRPSP